MDNRRDPIIAEKHEKGNPPFGIARVREDASMTVSECCAGLLVALSASLAHSGWDE
jgi:hypothetical protein